MASCPRCGSPDIFGKKFGFGNVTLHEYSCNACTLFEDKKSTDADFTTWSRSWNSRPEEEDENENEVVVGEDTTRAREELLDAICADVANDALRLHYADLIERRLPERADFIRLQVNRARVERGSGALRSAPGERETWLRERFGTQWANDIAPYARPLGSNAPYRGYEFERGFIAELRTDPDMVADPRDYLFKSAPIEHLDLTNSGRVAAAFESPRMAQLRSLGLRQLGLGDDDMVALARDARLDRCEWLDLRSNCIGLRGVQALVASERIRTIPVVLLAFNPCDPGMQYDDDHAGSIEMWQPAEGAELEAAFGQIPWLHLPPVLGLPDRYHASSVRYLDDE